MNRKPKIFRITTVAVSMNIILKGQLSFLNRYYDITGITTPDEKHFHEVEKREGIRMIPVQLARTIRPWQDFISLLTLYRLFREEMPDIVHTHTPKAGLLGMLAAWLAGVPVRLHTVGGIPWMEISGIKRVVLRGMEYITYACAHRVYPNSRGLLTFIESQKLGPYSKFKVIGNGGSNGINTEFFLPDPLLRERTRLKYNIEKDEIVLGFVGRIAKEKGIAELLETFGHLRKKYTIKIVLVGLFERTYGGLDPQTEQKITDDPDILYPGRFDDVRPFYSMMDIFVFPSYREGFPNAVLEACAMGLPVVATDINGCNEIIVHRENGLLVTPKSAESLQEALTFLLNHTEACRQMGIKGREHVIRYFRRELVWEDLKSEYDYFIFQST